MSVITISRQLGSLGDEVANEVAARLGYRVVGRDLIYQAARRAHTPEMALEVIDELGLLGIAPSTEAEQAYNEAMRAVMLELAQTGDVVIVGRAGCVVLSDYPAALHVRVVAPPALRAHRVALEKGVGNAAALAQVEVSDRMRALYLRRFHEADWDNTALFDLVVNTRRLSVDDAATLICLAQRVRREAAATTGVPTESVATESAEPKGGVA